MAVEEASRMTSSQAQEQPSTPSDPEVGLCLQHTVTHPLEHSSNHISGRKGAPPDHEATPASCHSGDPFSPVYQF